MEKITDKEAENMIRYFNENHIESVFEGEGIDHILKIKVKNDVDLKLATIGGELAWYDHGEYPLDFKAILTTEDGKQTSSFEYVGTAGIIPELEIDEYDALYDFEEFWKDNVVQKFNSNRELEFIIQDGIDVIKASKLIFDYINKSTKLGKDITIILINSKGERQKLLVPANS